ncbi:hypothetical protein BX600DRAFT_510632 [Xylariales sp. PMI_506]|nr:hypothetical protein BX600DRAFT_510632 [Xylariales sp. PMI_506]
MLFNSIVYLVFAASSLALEHNEAKRTGTGTTDAAATTTTASPASSITVASINPTLVSAQLQSLLGGLHISELVPSATQTLAISIPSSLRQEIMTAIPANVLVSLMNPAYRTSMASDFAAGNTPSWYQTLPSDLKTFFASMATAIKDGSAVYTVTSTTEAAVVSTTSSSGLAAAPTAVSREMAANVIALAGAAGIALLL